MYIPEPFEQFHNEDFTLRIMEYETYVIHDDVHIQYYVELIHFQYGDNIILAITDDKDDAYALMEHYMHIFVLNPPEYVMDASGRVFKQYDAGVGRLWKNMIENFGRA